GNPPVTPVGTVALSLGPTFSSAGAGTSLPRFTAPATASTIISVSACNAPSISLASSPNPSQFGQAVTLPATMPALTPTPTGTVTMRDGATVLRTVTLAGGQASATITGLAVGTHSLTATYSGDGSYTATTSGVLTQVVNKAATVTTANVGSGSLTVGQTPTFTA